MNIVKHLFKKDMVKIRTLLIFWLFLIVAHCVNSSAPILDHYKLQIHLPDIDGLIAALQYLMLIVIIPLVIQDDPLVGNSAFWLTRPISRKSLMYEKVLFLTFFLIVVPMIAEMFILISNGAAMKFVLLIIPEMLLKQLTMILPILFIACITQKFSKFALVGIIILVVFYVISMLMGFLPLLYDIELYEVYANKALMATQPYDPSLAWSVYFVKLILSSILGVFLLYHQFIYRNPKRTVKILIFGALTIMLVNKYWNWDFLNLENIKPKKLNIAQNITFEPKRSDVYSTSGFSFSKKNLDEKHKDIMLPQIIHGLESNQFAMASVLENSELRFSNGTAVTYEKKIKSNSGYNAIHYQKFINAVLATLKDSHIVNKYEKTRGYSLLTKIKESDFARLKELDATYTADGQFNVLEYRVADIVPLKRGEKRWVNNQLFTIHDIIKTSFGIKLIIGEKDLDISFANLDKKPDDYDNYFGFSRGMDYSDPFYVIRNKVTNEVFLPETAYDTQITKPKFNQSAELKSRVSQFIFMHHNNRNSSLPELNDEWLKNAELVCIKPVKLGYFDKKIEYTNITLEERKNYYTENGIRFYTYQTGEVWKKQPDTNTGKPVKVTTYYKDGTVMGQWTYLNGDLHGNSQEFYENGKLKNEWMYKNGERQGIAKHYFLSGELFYEYTFNKDELHGKTIKYDKKGNIVNQFEFEHDELLQ